jgi:hypothetical protein
MTLEGETVRAVWVAPATLDLQVRRFVLVAIGGGADQTEEEARAELARKPYLVNLPELEQVETEIQYIQWPGPWLRVEQRDQILEARRAPEAWYRAHGGEVPEEWLKQRR